MSDFLCITGTDTDAGKTIVTAALARAAHNRGLRTLIIKPVQTGILRDAAGKQQAPDLRVYHDAAPGAEARVAVLLDAPCSPHLAAGLEGRALTAAGLARAIRESIKEHSADLILLEGAGGLLTPLNEAETLADVFSLLDRPLLLTAANRLGAVNHALLSLESIKNRGLDCIGFVMTQPSQAREDLERTIRSDNRRIIQKLAGIPCLADIPHLRDMDSPDAKRRAAAWDEAARILDPVLSALPARQAPEAPARLLDFDRKHLWHPYTSALSPLPTREAVATLGNRIILRDGRELIDGMASWWCAVHGYRHPKLMEALRSQAARMPHVMFGGLTHEPAVNLGRKLLEMTPHGLKHVFFADSGSVAVEVALKMALQYHKAAGFEGRTRFLSLRGGYHGDTMGAMSVCDPENGMHSLFSGYLPQQVFAPRPECRFDAPYDPHSASALESVFSRHAPSLAAVILEPIVQGAGGMWFYHPEYLRKVRALCDEHDCLLILDEIATGFGRTGKLFACEHAGVSPDILCLGKGLTGGVMSLAAVLATSKVAQGLSQNGGVLMHGPTFMANPLACAVAAASLDLLSGGEWEGEVTRIEQRLRAGLALCKGRENVRDVRVLGAIGVVEMDRPVNTERLQSYFVDQWGVWIRPFGRLIYVMPPYTTPDSDLDVLTAAMHGAVEDGQWN
jgi:adenosylmethionine-8-amino-7-oxononanoate aminotransferase